MDALQHSWERAWRGLGAHPEAGLFDALVAAYREPHRHYHTVQHLAECLAQLEPALDLAEQAGEVELALWFHDAVYELTRRDNEARSAEWAAAAARAAGVPAASAERVHA